MSKTYVVALILSAACSSHNSAATPDGPPCDPTALEICGDGIDNNCNGQVDEGCNGIGTYVSALTGTDTNPGTQAMPVKTIAEGMTNAATLGNGQSVFVAEGTYAEKVALAEGVNLMGGYQCDATSCTWTRDPLAHDTIVANTDYEGVLAAAAVSHVTVVDGFHVVGKDGVPTAIPGSCGMTLAGGSPTLRNNRITGGNVTGGINGADRSIGVSVRSTSDPAGAIIGGNTLTGGTAVSSSVGIQFDTFGVQVPALATVVGNTIRGGAARQTSGLIALNTAAGTLVSKNDIAGGSASAGASYGILVASRLTIDANRINLDPATVGTCAPGSGGAPAWCAGIASFSSTSTITNNIVYGPKGARSAGVFLGEFEVAAGAVVLNANTLNGGGIGPSPVNRTESAALVVSIGACNSCGLNGHVGNVRNNILDGGNNNNRYGVREDPAQSRTMHPSLLDNNLFWFAPAVAGQVDVMYRQVAASSVATDFTTVAAINAMTVPACSANITGNPMLDASWHLMAASPCVGSGTLTEAPPTDLDGDARAPNMDISADQY